MVISSGPKESEVLVVVLGEGNGTPLQCSCLADPMDRGAWWAVVRGVAKLDSTEQLHLHFHFHALEKEMAAHSSVLAWRIPGTGSLVGCHLWGRTESGTTEATEQQQSCVTETKHKDRSASFSPP